VVSDLSRKAVPQYLMFKNSTIKVLYDSGLIDDKTLETGIENSVLNQARTIYFNLIQGDEEFSEGLAMPEILAYGFYKKIFSEKEISKITFGSGITLETFCKNYTPETLISKLKEQILNK